MRCTILINNYNYERFLAQCIGSALAQTVAAEVLVVDDGSVDSSRRIIEEYGDNIIRIYQENAGQAAAFNAGIAAATGDIVAFLDADDWFLPGKVEAILEAFQRNPEAAWLRHDFVLAAEDGSRVVDAQYNFPRPTSAGVEYIAFGETIGATSCLAFRRTFLEADVGPLPTTFTGYADTYLRCTAALLGQCVDVPQSLAVRRMHKAQMSDRRRGAAIRAVRRVMQKEICALKAAEIGKQIGDAALANGDVWWQHKSFVHASCLRDPLVSRLSTWLRYLASLSRSDLPTRVRVAFALREGVLASVPSRVFPALWWLSNDGRPVLSRVRTSQAGPRQTGSSDLARIRTGLSVRRLRTARKLRVRNVAPRSSESPPSRSGAGERPPCQVTGPVDTGNCR